jgi:hypothetical protein
MTFATHELLDCIEKRIQHVPIHDWIVWSSPGGSTSFARGILRAMYRPQSTETSMSHHNAKDPDKPRFARAFAGAKRLYAGWSRK